MRSAHDHRKRRGSALLLCTLAAAVLATAAIAILRSGQRSIARIESIRACDSGRQVADGLVQRAIATLRVDGNASGLLVDPNSPLPDATCRLTPLAANATQIQVFLYAGATTPAVDMVVDPSSPPIAPLR